jgi:hypothetical protein
VVAKVEWHPGELYPRDGFIVTNMTRPAEGVVAFYNQRGTAEQWIREGKNALTWTRLSCHRFAANAVRRLLAGEACPDPRLSIGRASIWAGAAFQKWAEQAATEKFLVARLERGLPSVPATQDRGLSGKCRL